MPDDFLQRLRRRVVTERLVNAALLAALLHFMLKDDNPDDNPGHNPGARRARAPRQWWRRPLPKRQRTSYRRKSDALNVFRSENQELIDTWGGETIGAGASEFDAINALYGFEGKHQITTIADALWVSIPASSGPPFFVEDIDVDLLNETSPGQIAGGFRLPDYVLESIAAREFELEGERAFVAEHETADCFTRHRSKSGQFNGRRRRPAGAGRERTCVCRERGRFVRCPVHEPELEELPF